ncbi:aldehyde dehydrogenase family protein [Pseudochryseolinea flava]|uniref:aldehyde dehydrogenase (NAD(+)) n=1 Tax=Pseudochryseolinea flava TaxID=2059302 RepID=A0A364Y1A9_9BACT|nr:aldehyde dehydrogenase family protein [Pseudochryseolinea flava]RAW00494.1 aldehyde dehydrogenase family protein [Pseudochryseolinea flava]
MKLAHKIFINGNFVSPQGNDIMEIVNPANEKLIGEVALGNEQDALAAIASAKRALPAFAQTARHQRQYYLQRLHDTIIARLEDLKEATIEEYGATVQRARWSNHYAAETFLLFKELLGEYEFEKTISKSKLIMQPVGVTAIFTAWNANAGSICVKLAAAIAAGCTVVIKPSEMSALQTKILMECFAEAGLPPGVINVVNGRGDVLGPVLSTHPDVARVTFTGSTAIGKIIARNAIDTMKRMTLELSGKSPNIILDDADLSSAIPMAVNECFQNNGQACVAGSRLIVPKKLLPEIRQLVIEIVRAMKVGDPRDERTTIGPLASEKQYQRIQHYIRVGIEEGAELLIGGEGKPDGLSKGYYVKPTVFVNVTPTMTIAREEIFGPVLSILTYETEDEAVQMANDTVFGLQAYISSTNMERANKIAAQIDAGRVSLNTMTHDPLAPFGGFKQSGIGREGGIFGLEQQLEPKVILN